MKPTTVARKLIDDKPYGIYAWAILIVAAFVFVLIADVWLHRSGHEMMTDEFREGLRDPLYGVILNFLWFGAFAAGTWHFYIGPWFATFAQK